MSSEDSINSIAAHMRALGLGALAHANWHANYMSFTNDYSPELSVVQAAHAGELLIKARIAAREHATELAGSPSTDRPCLLGEGAAGASAPHRRPAPAVGAPRHPAGLRRLPA